MAGGKSADVVQNTFRFEFHTIYGNLGVGNTTPHVSAPLFSETGVSLQKTAGALLLITPSETLPPHQVLDECAQKRAARLVVCDADHGADDPVHVTHDVQSVRSGQQRGAEVWRLRTELQ